MSAPSWTPPTNPNCDHRKRKNIPFLAISPPNTQHLRCNPLRVINILNWGAPCRIQALNDHAKAKIGDPRTAGGVHKDLWLAGHQYSGERKSRTIAYSLEISVDHVAGVDVVEAFGDVR